MTRRLLATGSMLTIAMLAACDAGGTDTRTFPVAHMSPGNAHDLILPYVPGGEDNISMSDVPRAITVTAPAGRLDQIGEMLSRYDVVAPAVRLRFQLIEADGFAGVDPAIADVEAALRELFRFQGYRLVTEAMVTSTQHNASSQRLLGFGDVPLNLTVAIDRIGTGDGVRSVDLHVAVSSTVGDFLRTRVVIPHGQTVVLGNARPFEDRGALILVVRPEIQ